MKTACLVLSFFLLVSSLRAELKAPYVMPALLSGTKVMVPGALYQGETREKIAALTFDDGPSPVTPQLLDVLASEKVTATFFVLGDRLKRYPQTLRRIGSDGHLIALHGYEHANLHGKSEAWLVENVNREKALIAEIVGRRKTSYPWFFRPPFGAMSPRIVKTIQSTRTRVVMCSILPGQQGLNPDNWTERPEVTTARVLRDLSPGAIIALHDGRNIGAGDGVFDMLQAPETARAVIRALKKEGYRFVRLDRMPDPGRKQLP